MVNPDHIPMLSNPLCVGNGVVGLVFYVFGKYMKKHPPKTINWFYGYRTPSSFKSQERWDFARVYSAKEMVKMGVVFIILGVVCLPIGLLFSINRELLLIIMIADVLVIVFAYLFKTERTIRKKFG